MQRFVFFMFALLVATPAAQAASAKEGTLPVPRFVSLRSDEVNLRTGPGTRYPIDWVLVRKAMPAEVVEEFETWRKIRVLDGTVGWVQQQMLSGKRTAMVQGEIRYLHRRAGSDSTVLARMEPGVVVDVRECRTDWCQVQVGKDGPRGWVVKAGLWGVYPGEVFE